MGWSCNYFIHETQLDVANPQTRRDLIFSTVSRHILILRHKNDTTSIARRQVCLCFLSTVFSYFRHFYVFTYARSMFWGIFTNSRFRRFYSLFCASYSGAKVSMCLYQRFFHVCSFPNLSLESCLHFSLNITIFMVVPVYRCPLYNHHPPSQAR